jgi:hypothetical protein
MPCPDDSRIHAVRTGGPHQARSPWGAVGYGGPLRDTPDTAAPPVSFTVGMTATTDDLPERSARLSRVAAAIVIAGALGMAAGLVGPAWFFVAGLVVAAIGAVLSKFGEPADWWPGLLIRGS